ncbi:unnamed protein product (macronuclear) [Paramecium tetraurelia]|uniref:RING-type domain-containing protein n=1 Tax=Paramecium tetraurelia TaxID=5888 RepID=A0DR73_PARTE|nr:uncharacterized protein GSPATT00019257001 [Paramecium tetraurelia]CAK85540.1 unnamed protein product [Paramecium tetraurelia]|eukprot:XP_001452937.1 hypothetical protein (macronuclear) [Paramecium tetraurelia strain d4-2]
MNQVNEGDVIQIPEYLKQQYGEWGNYFSMQFIGSNLSITLLMSILDCLLANNHFEKLRTLVNPNKPYTRYAQEIAQKIQSCILKDRNLSKFYHSASINDPNFTRAKSLLFEFCNYPQQMIVNDLIQKLYALSKVFQLSFCIFGDYFLKMGTQKTKIFIYLKDNQYYYIRQFDENQQSNVGEMDPSQSNQQQHLNQNSEPNNFDVDNGINLIFKFKLIEVYHESENRNDTKLVQVQQNHQKELTENQIEQENHQDNNQKNHQNNLQENHQHNHQDNFTQSDQTCMNCNEATQTPLFVNKACNHQFCSKCLNLKITNVEINYKCLNRDCSSLIDLQSYYSYCSGDASINKRVEIIELEFKQCNNCGKNELKRKQLISAQKNNLCRECSRKSTTTLEQQQIPNQQEIDLEKIKEQSILFGCSNCQGKIDRRHLYFDENCLHLLCFCCSNNLILNRNSYSAKLRCPVLNCTQFLNQLNFDYYFEKQQQILLQQQEQQQAEQKQDIFIQPLEQVSEKQNIELQMEVQMTEEEELNYQTIGQCTFCSTDFSIYNKRQKLDCKKHQIGVCCSLMNFICPQCNEMQFQNSKNFNNMSGIFKLRKDSKQTFDSCQFQFD